MTRYTSEHNSDLRVLHLIPQFGRGGAERVICELASGMRKSHNIQALIAWSGGEWTSQLDRLGLQWLRVPLFPSRPINAIRSFFALRRIVRQYHIDLIHSHHRFSSLVGRVVCLTSNTAFVCTVHDLASGNRLISVFAQGETVTVFSQAVQSHLIEHFGLNEDFIYRVPMGLRPAVKLPAEQILAMRRERGCASPIPVIGFVGRLAYEKGPDILLRAMPHILVRFPQARFWIVGDGDMRDELEILVDTLGIREKVIFFGGQDDVSLLMSCFDITVVPSLREGFGLAALESLAHGKPVIATQVGGLPELVQHDQNGILIPPGQSVAVAEAVIRLLGNRELLLEMGVRARETIRGRFSIEAMLREMRLVYQSALERQNNACLSCE